MTILFFYPTERGGGGGGGEIKKNSNKWLSIVKSENASYYNYSKR